MEGGKRKAALGTLSGLRPNSYPFLLSSSLKHYRDFMKCRVCSVGVTEQERAACDATGVGGRPGISFAAQILSLSQNCERGFTGHERMYWK
jgi:hypothetical protein